MSLKNKLLEACHNLLATRRSQIQSHIQDLQKDLQSETKNTAGDKHETGRAMLHIELEKAGMQLKALTEQQQMLNRLQESYQNRRVVLGSVVITSGANYFIAISLGQIHIDDQLYYSISQQSPIGQLLTGKTRGERLTFRGEEVKIIKIL